MTLNPGPAKGREYVVGSEISLETLLKTAEVQPLLKAMISAGAEFTGVADAKGRFLLTAGEVRPGGISAEVFAGGKPETPSCKSAPLYYEGEPFGALVLYASTLSVKDQEALLGVAITGLNIVIRNTAKRIMTSELHIIDVERSYDELLVTNHELAASEKKYRELAGTLEEKVAERTAELEKAYSKLLQQEKMASIGQLAAGVAHEINNPTGFIYSNMNTFLKYIKNLQEMLLYYKRSSQEFFKGPYLKQAEDLYEKLRIDFILRDTQDLVRQSLDGAERIKKIVSNLKDFSHIDEAFDREMDLNLELDNILNVLAHELREKGAAVVKKYGSIHGFYGNPGLICQGLFNILSNALQAREEGLIITITTEQTGNIILISIADNGKGIPPDIKNRIFEPFFTTKEIGKGTGMGLTVAYDIIAGYGGNIEVKSGQDEGAEFIITLPLRKGGLS